MWHRYVRLLNSKPLLVKSLTAGFLSLGADIVCQVAFKVPDGSSLKPKVLELKKDQLSSQLSSHLSDFQIDWFRLFQFTALGTFLVGPTLHYWYGFLGRIITGTGMEATLKRLALDQILFAPAFISTFFAAALTLEGKTAEIPDKINNDLYSTVVANYFLWIPAQFINFRFIPPPFQVLVSNSIGFFWNIYLSFVTYKSRISDKSAESGEK